MSKADLAKAVYKKTNGLIPLAVIKDATDILFDDIGDKLVSGGSVSIENFGTICHTRHEGHPGFNVSSGDMQYVESFDKLVFEPHYVFSELIQQRIKKLKKDNK